MPPGVSDIRRFGEGGGCNEGDIEVCEASMSIGESAEEFDAEGRWVAGCPSSARARALPMSVIIGSQKKTINTRFLKRQSGEAE